MFAHDFVATLAKCLFTFQSCSEVDPVEVSLESNLEKVNRPTYWELVQSEKNSQTRSTLRKQLLKLQTASHEQVIFFT